VQVAELKSSDVCARQVAEVSRQWVGMKKTSRRELRFLTRPPQYDDESDVRKFYAHAGDRLLGYGHFDPLYEHGQVIGYTANILRARPDAPGGTLDLLKVAAIEQFRAEGKSRLSLGLCPLAGLERRDPIANSRCAEFWARQFATRFKWLYSFPTLYFHKRRYDGIEEPVYATTNSRAIALNGLRIFQLCGVI
jgi:phosphatidylglycerol lysyltransferase